MRIALIEPFFSGSHKKWALTLQQFSIHKIDIFSLPGRHWKWRMHNGAVSLAEQFNKSKHHYDLILATDMLNFGAFLSLTRAHSCHAKTAIYFHENQMTYPWSPTDVDRTLNRDNHYAFINYTSALCADEVFFNSQYHHDSFVQALPAFLKQFPDHKELHLIKKITQKSKVLPLLLDLSPFFNHKKKVDIGHLESSLPCVFLWNHRWEYDKNPDHFFNLMDQLKERNYTFSIIVLGESYGQIPDSMIEAKKKLSTEIIHWGFAKSQEEYIELVSQADVLPVTSNQDFFGGSVVESIALNVRPILPYRLAYPEHIPEELHDTFLYRNDQDLLEKAIWTIEHISDVRKLDYSTMVQKYEPSLLIKKYDLTFEKLIENV